MGGIDQADWLAKPSSPAERVWWARVERKAHAAHTGPSVPKVISDWAHATLRVIGEQSTVERKQTEIKRLATELGRRLGVGPPPDLGTLPIRRNLNLRELTDDELDEVEEIAGRIEKGEV